MSPDCHKKKKQHCVIACNVRHFSITCKNLKQIKIFHYFCFLIFTFIFSQMNSYHLSQFDLLFLTFLVSFFSVLGLWVCASILARWLIVFCGFITIFLGVKKDFYWLITVVDFFFMTTVKHINSSLTMEPRISLLSHVK